MATDIPLNFRLAPLPVGFVGTPQQLATAIVERLSAVSANTISFFASGSVAPTSNVGPWLKNGTTWYVWSDTLATYVPEVIEAQSLGYIFSQVEPDSALYKVWYKLDGSSNPIGIFLYTNGSWQDAYASQFAAYYTSAQTDAAITTAIGSLLKYPFSAIKLVNQTITAGDPPAAIVYPTEQYDPESAYDSGTSVFTVPATGIYNFKAGVQMGLATGTPTNISIALEVVADGAVSLGLATNESGDDTGSRSMLVDRDVALTAGQTVSVRMSIVTTGASTWEIDTNSASGFFSGKLIQTI